MVIDKIVTNVGELKSYLDAFPDDTPVFYSVKNIHPHVTGRTRPQEYAGKILPAEINFYYGKEKIK